MNIFIEVNIRAEKGTDYLINGLREFASQSSKWNFDELRSKKYSRNLMDTTGCILLFEDDKWSPAFAVCEERPGLCRLVSIVPKDTGEIPRQEYNSLARRFFDDIGEWSRRNKKGLRLSISKTDLELSDIISAEIPRKFFLTFLNNHPLSYHPLDIQRLDRFICAVSRYSRKTIQWEHLREYLLRKKGWPESNVDWCINRIGVGLEIIKQYKRFH